MRYLNILKNQYRVSRAWMLTTLVLIIISIVLAVTLVKASNSMPVRLVSYDYLANNGYVTVKEDGLSDAVGYLESIAAADVTNYTTWSNKNADKQHARFVNRLSPALYNKIGKSILDTGNKKSETQEAQTFFIEETKVSSARNTVQVVGLLRMYQGIEVSKSTKMIYELEYNNKNQVPKITSFKAKELK
ncbi:TraE/TraK family type IV conjugative transfer system protein [Marinospirillum insulare]|nr:TraE/TraK family type IV conjugative transfer system protein [Marinospirillum insulare]